MDAAELARRARCHTARMVHQANASHIGGCYSMAELLAVLYSSVLRIRPSEPDWSERDRFILSKGHSTAILYAILAECGFISRDELDQYGRDGSRLLTHVSHRVPGVEFSTGSLGHGLPFACGRALAAQRLGHPWRTFVMLSDGELDEGSNWEAILFAGHHRLGRLTAIIDYNGIQSLGHVAEVLELHHDKHHAAYVKGANDALADSARQVEGGLGRVERRDHVGGLRNIYFAPFYDVGNAYLSGHQLGANAHAVGAGLRLDVTAP